MASPSFNGIRQFTEEDIPQVAELHRRVFGIADQTSPELRDSYQAYFTQVFLNNPWRNEEVGSLVYHEKSGRVIGFLALMPRRMSFNGKTIQAVIVSQFIVDPAFRGRGVELLGAALAGPQDISIGDEANSACRMIWEGLGGVTSRLYSMHWIYPLRPCRFALFVAEKKRFLPRFLSTVSAPFALTLDALAGRILKFPSRPSVPRVFEEELDCETMSACLSEVGRKQSIRPDYDESSLSWILQRADRLRRNGRLQKVLVKTKKQEIAGWYLYYLNPSGFSEVIQFYAKARFTRDVLDHLFHHAWQRGAIALSGRMEPSYVQAFSDKHCLFHCGPEWVLVHSRNPELVQAFDRGNGGFSRLDGEWCLHFQ
jgi:GNAT superfamily N-acetyltransferase